MKFLTPPLLSLLLVSSLAVAASPPELSFDFNNSQSVQVSSGATQVEGQILGEAKPGGSGSGVTGQPEDRAFDNSAAASITSDGIFLLPDVHEVRGREQLTVTLWYRVNGGKVSGEGERLADYGENWLFFADAPGRLSVQVPTGGTGQSSPDGSYQTEGWVFAAFTFDAATSTVTYYRGGVQNDAKEAGRRWSFTEPMPDHPTPLQFGNNSARTRAFAGFLDNIKVFATALNPEEIEAIRQSDLGL